MLAWLPGVALAGGAPKDKDADGIPNREDSCKNDPETHNGFADEDGCPDVLPTVRFVPIYGGEELSEAVLTVRSSNAPDTWTRGAFESTALPGVMYSVSVASGSCLTGDVKVMHGDEDRTIPIEMVMNESAGVSIRPTGPDGGWLSGVVAQYVNVDPMCPSATLDVAENEPHKVAAGTYAVQLTADGYADHSWTIEVDSGREVVLEPRFGVEPSLEVPAPGARVWVPHPHGIWMAPHAGELADLKPGTGVRVEAPGRIPATVVLNGEQRISLERTPEAVSLTLSVGVADIVEVDGEYIKPGEQGVVALALQSGEHALHVSGGGRDIKRELELERGRRYWVTERVPDAHVLLFGPDKTRPDPGGRDKLIEMAEHIGLYDFAIVPYLPMEGSASFDTKLANDRAQSVLQILLDAGISEARLQVREPHAAFDGDAKERRRLEIVPVLATLPGAEPTP